MIKIIHLHKNSKTYNVLKHKRYKTKINCRAHTQLNIYFDTDIIGLKKKRIEKYKRIFKKWWRHGGNRHLWQLMLHATPLSLRNYFCFPIPLLLFDDFKPTRVNYFLSDSIFYLWLFFYIYSTFYNIIFT